MQFKRIAIDTSKTVFTLHGVDEEERPVLRRNVNRAGLVDVLREVPATEVVLEACGAAHHWGRTLGTLGHQVRLIPPQYVKPFVKRGRKNDRNDAEAIAEAASRPSMRDVPVKSAETQASLMVLRVRQLLVRQRTQTINALRGHAAEFGVVVGRGCERVPVLVERVSAREGIPALAREMITGLAADIASLDERIAALDRRLKAMQRSNPTARLLAEVPGIGPIGSISLALSIDAQQFRSGRHLASWLGLTPKEHSSGGKVRLGGITRAGNERLRQLLVVGATAVIRLAGRDTPPEGTAGSSAASRKAAGTFAGLNPATAAWLVKLLERRPRKLAAVALANKMARIVWAMLMTGEAYRRGPQGSAPMAA